MITRYRVSLGGVQLDSLDDNLAILDVQYSPLTKQERHYQTAGLDGFDTGEEKYEGQTVTITFELHIYDTAERNMVCQAVNKWANTPGSLVINDREGQYLRAVKCQQFAAIGSVRNWTDPITIIFTSERTPFWLSSSTKAVTISGKNAKGTLDLDGNVGNSLIECEVTAQAAVSSVQITVGDTVLKLSKLSIATGEKLVIDYTRSRYLRIRANGSSVLTKLDASSSDLLLAPCGAKTTVGIIANNKVTAKFTGRGCWL